MNRINIKLQEDKKILSIYFTAGYPNLNDTVSIIQKLEKSGVDMIEIGLPFSDPLADGPTIQESSSKALENGMTTKLLFEQLAHIRETVQIPLIIMGYFNPILQFGMEKFCEQCAQIGIDGLIIPDLPLEIFEQQYQSLFEKYNLKNIRLITPQTSEERIRKIDALSDSFIYMVSSSSTTGGQSSFGESQQNYFNRITQMQLKNPQIIGFGISNQETFSQATKQQKGGIIGSAFIQHLNQNKIETIPDFVAKILC
ncbi:tryptophan synthase subunit alpha [Flavobacterium luminosum]|uniref:Tryptophan synthase alpha chain n=1 Tax=Flavobacterium luminosum TaxID=2949086 RepID=A0ABT0TN13_9FLAO|nr:tryptophan synthase subunit alpha [Flavobacterium sp. HXWNR70]MCL9808878.1 tryptophan synthase subunit alpha [Flavobacterium sp. HXWNR70]